MRSILVSTHSRESRSKTGILFTTEGFSIVTLDPVPTRKVTSTPKTLPVTRGPSAVSVIFFTGGSSGGSLALGEAAGLRLASPAGSRFPAP